jgi:hypothetical protein
MMTAQQMIADGWRRCAVGQRTTQQCGMAEEARAQERRRIRGMVQWLLLESLPRHQAWPDEAFNQGVQTALRHVIDILDRKNTSHE